MLPLFQDNFILGEATSSQFFRVTALTQQLIFGAAISLEQLLFPPFSEQSLFRRSYFFRIASFSERNFYRAGTF